MCHYIVHIHAHNVPHNVHYHEYTKQRVSMETRLQPKEIDNVNV